VFFTYNRLDIHVFQGFLPEIGMKFSRLSLLLILGLSITTRAHSETPAPPDTTVDGMQRVKNTELALVYAKPGVDLSRYNRLLVIEPKVSFVSRWLQNQNAIPNQRVRPEDMERIKTELAQLFMEVFEQELQNNAGYVLVDGAAEDVLIVFPAITDLNVTSPHTPGTRGTRSAIASVGSMSLNMELIDSITGDRLVRVFDNKFDRTRVQPGVPNKTRNEAAARDMLGQWAVQLRMALDEARTVISR
jgi:hypothetical protein